MTRRIQTLSDTIYISIRWIRVWLYIVGFGCLLVGVFQRPQRIFLIGGSSLIALSLVLYGVLIGLKSYRPRRDDYAASIHRAGIEQFFTNEVTGSKLNSSLAEIVRRTTFTRPNSIQPINEFGKMLTVVVFLATVGVFGKLLVSPVLLYVLACGFTLVYLSDSWFALRSRLYFHRRKTIDKDDLDTAHLEHMVDVFADQLGIQSPEIIYTESERLLAGETNGYFVRPQLYVSTQLLEQQNHIQTGILAHELAHMYLDETADWSYRYFQFLIPVLFVGFAVLPISAASIGGFVCGLAIVSVFISRQRHQEEFDADSVAAKLTQTEFVLLAILEFSNYNPFLDELSVVPKVITRLSSTHPRVSERITRLTNLSRE